MHRDPEQPQREKKARSFGDRIVIVLALAVLGTVLLMIGVCYVLPKM